MDNDISVTTAILVIIVTFWDLIWKGFALWRAARRRELAWFIAILILNTAGILPIIYLIISRRKAKPETDE